MISSPERAIVLLAPNIINTTIFVYLRDEKVHSVKCWIQEYDKSVTHDASSQTDFLSDTLISLGRRINFQKYEINPLKFHKIASRTSAMATVCMLRTTVVIYDNVFWGISVSLC